jgi:hypothetical protein
VTKLVIDWIAQMRFYLQTTYLFLATVFAKKKALNQL